jgi:hypothetical protein
MNGTEKPNAAPLFSTTSTDDNLHDWSRRPSWSPVSDPGAPVKTLAPSFHDYLHPVKSQQSQFWLSFE